MTLAERNWKNFITIGNLGVTGNILQKVTEISSSYTYSPGDGLLAIDTTSAEVIITLPPFADWPEKNYRLIIPIMHIAGTNNVKVKMSGSETFLLGNTYFDLGAQPFTFDFYVINSDTLSMYGVLNDLRIRAMTTYTGPLGQAAWAALSILPFDVERTNDQDELFLYQNYSTGVIADAADVGDGTILMGDVAHGLIVGDVITIAGTTSYNGDYAVVAVPDVDSFTITETFAGDESGTWKRFPRYTMLAPAEYSMYFDIQVDSTGGAAWSAIGSIYKNGTIIDNTSVTVSGAAGENKSMVLAPYEEFLDAGDYIDLRIDNTTLTGNLTSATLGIEFNAV